jgi:hypothetical protein
VRYVRVGTAAVAGAVMCGLLVPAAQTSAAEAAAKANPAQVVYTFNKIRPGGVVRDVSPPTNLRMELNGNWRRIAGASGAKKTAVSFRAKSRGVIRNSTTLIPKRRSFAVAMTVKLRQFDGADTPNLAQLGFYNDGGQWKVEALPKNGRIQFRVKGKSGSVKITSRRSIDDGEYHTVVCYRKRGKIGVIVDGQRRVRERSVGSIQSKRNVVIANKHLRTADDQFRGNFDYFSIALGRKSVARALAKAPTIP